MSKHSKPLIYKAAEKVTLKAERIDDCLALLRGYKYEMAHNPEAQNFSLFLCVAAKWVSSTVDVIKLAKNSNTVAQRLAQVTDVEILPQPEVPLGSYGPDDMGYRLVFPSGDILPTTQYSKVLTELYDRWIEQTEIG